MEYGKYLWLILINKYTDDKEFDDDNEETSFNKEGYIHYTYINSTMKFLVSGLLEDSLQIQALDFDYVVITAPPMLWNLHLCRVTIYRPIHLQWWILLV